MTTYWIRLREMEPGLRAWQQQHHFVLAPEPPLSPVEKRDRHRDDIDEARSRRELDRAACRAV
jgi:hypothetical protein